MKDWCKPISHLNYVKKQQALIALSQKKKFELTLDDREKLGTLDQIIVYVEDLHIGHVIMAFSALNIIYAA